MFSTTDTIVAIATPPGRGGIGIVRVSGARAGEIASVVLQRARALAPRRATLARVVDPREPDVPVDRVLATFFPRPGSYTGEDVLELSAHGSPTLLRQIVAAAMAAGARLAEPGEFTFRAFLNGRLDLAQAEAVADLVEAVTPAQARAAFDQLEGTFTTAVAAFHQELFDLSARLEASLDFPDEGYHFVGPEEASETLGALVERLDRLLAGADRGRLLREGRTVAILGRANAGKSSIFNRLVGASRAIVAAMPGTTRDLVTETTMLEGAPITLVDTAGFRASTDEVESEGVSRARGAGQVAELCLIVLDRSQPLDADDSQVLEATAGQTRVIALNKSDLPAAWDAGRLDGRRSRGTVAVSALTGEGIDELRGALAGVLGKEDPRRDPPAVTNIRHITLLQACRAALGEARAAAMERRPEELVLADLRRARGALEEITGQRTSEDLLRHIFERFCIGK